MFCRQKRIVKRTHTDGSTEYVGQTKSLFGWEDGEGKLRGLRNRTFKTYDQALKWYNQSGTRGAKDEVLSSGYQPRDTGSTYSQSKPSPSFITEEMIEKYREL